MTIAPLRLSYDVDCPATHAFEVWTTRLTSWWPKGHTASGDPATVVTLEPHVGGRIYERASDGREIDWGEITAWDPPRGFEYLWFIAGERAEATTVALSFVDLGDGTTRLEIVQSGWERLGADAQARRDTNAAGWNAAVGAFLTATRS